MQNLPRFDHYIDGALVPPSSGEYLPTQDPYTGETWAEVARGNAADANRAVEAAALAFEAGPWPGLTATERGRLLLALVVLGDQRHQRRPHRRKGPRVRSFAWNVRVAEERK